MKVIDAELTEIEREAPKVQAELAQKNMDDALAQMEYLELHKQVLNYLIHNHDINCHGNFSFLINVYINFL